MCRCVRLLISMRRSRKGSRRGYVIKLFEVRRTRVLRKPAVSLPAIALRVDGASSKTKARTVEGGRSAPIPAREGGTGEVVVLTGQIRRRERSLRSLPPSAAPHPRGERAMSAIVSRPEKKTPRCWRKPTRKMNERKAFGP